MKDTKYGIGKFGLGRRNERGDRPAEFSHAYNLSIANTLLDHQNNNGPLVISMKINPRRVEKHFSPFNFVIFYLNNEQIVVCIPKLIIFKKKKKELKIISA